MAVIDLITMFVFKRSEVPILCFFMYFTKIHFYLIVKKFTIYSTTVITYYSSSSSSFYYYYHYYRNNISLVSSRITLSSLQSTTAGVKNNSLRNGSDALNNVITQLKATGE
jgi:hypothetical protein